MKCSICGKEIEAIMKDGEVLWDEGNNAWPVNEGRCCNECNRTVVLPAREKLMGIAE
jgi:hypothetical protein